MSHRASPVVIAIDAMGGDVGLNTTLAAAQRVQQQHADLQLILVGDSESITQHPLYRQLDLKRLSVHHATQVVAMDESPSSVLRHKRDSSMWKALELVRDGQAQACVSAGNTGALMACARFVVRMLPGIDRPAICATVPSQHGHTHWLDLGANVDSKAPQLFQFALMGSELARAVDGRDAPRLGLLNVGEEEIKGSETVKETAKLLEQSSLNYIGFVEGNDIFTKKDLDVVVCDGFVGNVALKTAEGVAKFFQQGLRSAFQQNLWSKCAALMAYPVMKRLKSRMDPRSYNGASLLGLQGIVVKSHGNADDFAFANAIHIARLQIANNVIPHIQSQLEQWQNRPVDKA